MARSRVLRPDFFTDATLAKLSRDARIFFAGLWVEADDEGRLYDSPKQLAGNIFPHDDDVSAVDARRWLDELEALGRVVRYEVDGTGYVFIVNFAKHQKPPHPAPSKLPAPPDLQEHDSRVPREKLAKNSRGLREDFASDSRELREDFAKNSRPGFGSGFGFGSGPIGPPKPPTASRPAPPETTGDDEERKPDPDPLYERWWWTLDPFRRYHPDEQTLARNILADLRKHLDDRAIDECIGQASTHTGKPPRSSRYLHTVARNYAKDRGLAPIPELDPKLDPTRKPRYPRPVPNQPNPRSAA